VGRGDHHRRHRSVFIGVAAVCAAALLGGPLVAAGGEGTELPWWKTQKIRYLWGQWGWMEQTGASADKVMTDLSRVGATVYVDARGRKDSKNRIETHGVYYDLDNAAAARRHRVHYFGEVWICYLPEFASQFKDFRRSMNKEGKPYASRSGEWVCPVYKPVYEAWLLAPTLKAARSGLVEGLHIDYEFYGGQGEADVCFCDDCFRTFMEGRGLTGDLPAGEKRYAWLEERELVEAYAELVDERREAMFRGFEQRVHEVDPAFIFAGYNVFDSPWSRGLHTPEVPFWVVDSRHYFEDRTRPWWDSVARRFRERGFVRIAGSWDNSFFGGRPDSDIGAAQWMYEAAMHSAGHWLWFEQELTPDVLNAFWIADRRIRAVESHVGRYFWHGRRDRHFVTAVEWTGSPELARAVKHLTYHLDGRHLVQLDNVDADRPVRVRLRFPRLSGAGTWVVRDALSGVTYVPEAGRDFWDEAALRRGVDVSLEKRSDLFLELAPRADAGELAPGMRVLSQDIDPLPGHPPAGEAPAGVALPGEGRLLTLATKSLGFLGAQGGWAIGNAIMSINADGGEKKELHARKGYPWEPVWSPDGKRIAFTCYSNGRGQICVMNADGTGVTNVSDNGFSDRSPSWSPDGTRLAFASDRDADWEIYVMKGDGSDQQRLTDCPGADLNPKWSPAGEVIAFESDRGGDTDLYSVNADGGEALRLTDLPGLELDAAWSPDGTELACSMTDPVCMRSLIVVKADGSGWRYLDRFSNWIPGIAWSPDGKHIAATFRGPQERDTAGVFVVDSDSAGEYQGNKTKKVLVKLSSARPHPGGGRGPHPTWYSSGGASPRWVVKTFGEVAWSPDGKTLAFSSDMGEDGAFYVYTIPSKGGQPKRLDATKSAWPQEVMWQVTAK